LCCFWCFFGVVFGVDFGVVVGDVVGIVVVGEAAVVVVFLVVNVVVVAVAAAVASLGVFGTVVFESLTALLYKIGAVIHPASIDVKRKLLSRLLFYYSFFSSLYLQNTKCE
jgi:hypothetical protein